MDAKTSEWRAGPNVCRCCLTEGCYKDISTEYFWMGKREVYAEMLADTLNVSISYSQSGGPNSNSRLICELCISRLRDASDFKRQVLECEKSFTQHLDAGASNILELDVTVEPADSDVKLEHVKQEKQLSDDDDDFDDRCGFDDDDDDDLDDQPLTKLATKIPKKETVDILDLLDNSKATEKRKSSTKTKAVPAKKTKSVKKEPVKAGASKVVAKTDKKKKGIIQKSNSTITLKDEDGKDIKLTLLKYPISLDSLEYEQDISSNKNFNRKLKKKLNKVNLKKDNEITNMSMLKEPVSLNNIKWKTNEDDLESSVTINVKTVQRHLYGATKKRTKSVEYQTWKQNALIIFEYSYVYPFIHASNKYKCFICAKPFLDAHLLKDHTNEHNIKEMKRELSNRVRDKNLKVDVTYLQCKICLQSLTDLQNLKIHLKEHGKKIEPNLQDNIIPFKLGSENFECQICGEKYLKLRLLIIHMSKHYNNYSCEICGTVFISLHLLKRHLQIHESGSFPCDKCDKVFSNAAKRTLHYRGVHLKQFPRRCPICPERFNSNYQRTKHLRIVHNQTTGLYRCDTCGREYDLKYHLLIHIRSVHLQERNQECPVCNSRFFSKYCLSRHMVIHTGEKNFKCEICGKAYARRKNLREHSRTHEVGLCSICGQNCGDHNNLVTHVNNVHGVL
ncbi:zinc finger protein ZFP2-like isoform X3 [Helicoverpa zea]|uniref:zinc finger protein ZFP2-like isoform X3 n=1 Tax=Helicoverpa zea TaxID=7113 RepID=UPI001F5AD8EF|nr:zinc finger protein ZFP2-like isoform X3 [Helicoverpa zea]